MSLPAPTGPILFSDCAREHRNHDADEFCRSCSCPKGDGWDYAPDEIRAKILTTWIVNGVCKQCFNTGCIWTAAVEDAFHDACGIDYPPCPACYEQAKATAENGYESVAKEKP